MSRLSLSRAWDESKEILARDGGLLSAVALALLVLPEIVVGVISPPSVMSQSASGRLIAIVAAFVGIIGQLAIVRLTLGPSTTVGQAIAHGARRFPATMGAIIILIIAMAIVVVPLLVVLMMTGVVAMPVEGQAPPESFAMALLFIVIGALFLAVKLIMTVPVASAEHVGPLEILKRSWALTKGHYWTLFGVEVLLLVAALILLLAAQFVGGATAQIVGDGIEPFSLSALILALFMGAAQAVFTVLASVMLARIYVQLRGEAEVSVPSSGI